MLYGNCICSSGYYEEIFRANTCNLLYYNSLVAKYISHSVLRKKKRTSYRLTQCEYPPLGFSCCFLSLPVLLKEAVHVLTSWVSNFSTRKCWRFRSPLLTANSSLSARKRRFQPGEPTVNRSSSLWQGTRAPLTVKHVLYHKESLWFSVYLNTWP